MTCQETARTSEIYR